MKGGGRMTEREALEGLLCEGGLLEGPEPLLFRWEETVDSTISECFRLLRSGQARRCLVLADAQTAGRGRLGRSFFSPPGAGLYLSLGFTPPGGVADAVGITTYAAVATAERIEALTGLRCGVKWVNDLYLAGRKVCGILTEAEGPFVAVGVGVNLTASAVPEELRDIVGWLDRADIRVPLAAGLTEALLAYRPGDASHMAEYRRRSTVLGKIVRFAERGMERSGRATAIRDDGALVVQTATGQRVLQSGEVSVRGV